MSEIEKVKYHLALLAEALNHREQPIPSLVISLDWSRDDLNLAHDIFQEYDEQIERGVEPNWNVFESVFQDKLKISYQSLKSVVLAFYRNHQWTDVCAEYAQAKPCAEFYEINRATNESYELAVGRILGEKGMVYKRNPYAESTNVADEIDFLFRAGGQMIAIEAKTSIGATVAQKMVEISKRLINSKRADRVIVVSDKCTNEAARIMADQNIQVITKDQLEREVF